MAVVIAVIKAQKDDPQSKWKVSRNGIHAYKCSANKMLEVGWSPLHEIVGLCVIVRFRAIIEASWFCKASTTLGLDLCSPASPEFTGPWNEMPRPLMVITLKLHPFHISHLFLNVKWNLPHLNFDFSTLLYSLKLAEIVVECEIEMRPAPPPSLMNSGHSWSKLKVVLA